MGSSLSPVISNIFMEYFEILALDTAEQKPSLWLRYIGVTFLILTHGLDRLQKFFNDINSILTTFKFVMEIETETAIPFLDVLVIREVSTLNIKV
jgi:hypothetical protein